MSAVGRFFDSVLHRMSNSVMIDGSSHADTIQVLMGLITPGRPGINVDCCEALVQELLENSVRNLFAYMIISEDGCVVVQLFSN